MKKNQNEQYLLPLEIESKPNICNLWILLDTTLKSFFLYIYDYAAVGLNEFISCLKFVF